VNKSKLKPPWT